MLKILLVLASSQGLISLMRFGRNILIARLIGVEDFGIASTFALLMSLVEMLSDIGLARLVIQDRNGDAPDFVAAIHGLVLLRGAGLSLIVFLLADPIAALLGQPGLGAAYRVIAVIPVLRALNNLDSARQQRSMRFGLMIKISLSSMIVSLMAIGPLYLWLGDYRVMLGVIVIESLASMAASHLLAERSYRLGWSRAVTSRALSFGWPILLGGVAGFATLQGERLIVANQLTATDLGLFSAALTLALAPTIVVQSIVNRMFLPVLARHQDDEDAFRHKAELSLESLLVTGLTLMLTYVLVGPVLLPIVYGADFAAGAPLVAILGIAYTLRMVRASPTSISMAKGHTINLLLANILRFASFPAAFLIAVQGGGLVAIAMTGIAGEALALIAAYALIAIREGMAPVLARRAALYGIAGALALLLIAISVGIVSGPAPALAAVVLWLLALTRCQRFLRYLGGEVQRLRLRRP